MRSTVTVRLLGRFALHRDGAEVPLDAARAELLFAYLVLHPDAQPRRRLAAALWPDSTEAQAQTNLRKLLHTMRRRLPTVDDHLEITARDVRWRGGSDVTAFERLLTSDLRQAVALYGGDLLDGHDAPWLEPEGERLRGRWLDALAELADRCSADGELAEAVGHAERLLRGDPLREETYRQLMRLHAARGDRARALRIYHACSSILGPGARASNPPRKPTRSTKRCFPGGPEARPRRWRGGRAAAWSDARRAGAAGRRRGGSATQATRSSSVITASRGGEDPARRGVPGVVCAAAAGTTAEARCYAAEGALAYGPVISWLRSEALRTRTALARPRPARRARPTASGAARRDARPGAAPGRSPEERAATSDVRGRLRVAVSSPSAQCCSSWTISSTVTERRVRLSALSHCDREPSSRLLVVATARREELDGGQPAQGLLVGLRARERLQRARTGPG